MPMDILGKLAGIEQHYDEINRLMMDVGDDYQRAAELNKERIDLEPIVSKAREYRHAVLRMEEARSLVDGDDHDLNMLAEAEILELQPHIDRLERELKALLLPKDPRDERNVIMEIRAGTGGDEAALFAADLFRLYSHYAETRKWNIELLSTNEIGIGGFKEIIFLIKGKGAYSRLKYESGVHRVQRVPMTESQGRIHTSTATIAVLAEVDEVEINIPEADIRMDVYRSAGAGGQNVQKNATAVRITHIPTGIVVACQDERSQLQNRLRAMSILRARLYAIEEEKRRSEIDENRRSQVGTGERAEKIRTYNYPQDRISDHRINLTQHNLPRFMDGDLDGLIDALATAEHDKQLEEQQV